jgi:asparagine synthase (glutamine-hydrolysing)
MCGINGIISSDPDIRIRITRMNYLLRHRGPDDEGYVFINTSNGDYITFSTVDSIPEIRQKYTQLPEVLPQEYNLIFGHRRLSIIDLSESGHQPMSDAENLVWIVYNGEIYNYLELRDILMSEGYKFRTSSDTEVIIYSYLHWGYSCLEKFNGMWAFAIWDSRENKLFASRDRFGVKPLYYRVIEDGIIFSSEIKPLLIFDSSDRVNHSRIPFFILYGNRLNSDETYFKNIYSLKPSHYLEYKSGKIKTSRYYDIPVKDNFMDKARTRDLIITLLGDSINLRFRSDVKVGSCLSGGFDSSAIIALSDYLGHKNISTFSAVWNEPDCDESYFIDIVNSRFNCIPYKVIPSPDDFEKSFTELCYYQEIPTEGPGLYPQWYVMKEAHGRVKVLLDGQGGDEVFGGYFLYGAYLRSLIKDRNYAGIFKNFKTYFRFLTKEGFHSFYGWLFPRHYNRIVRAGLSRKKQIINKEILSRYGRDIFSYDAEPPHKFRNYLNNLCYHFINRLTIPTLLHYEDRSSMAHSIESREPFLDYRLVELGVNMKPEFLSEGEISRPLYREAVKSYLPREIILRKDKLGFPTPFRAWTRTILKDYITSELTGKDNPLKAYINSHVLQDNLLKHFGGKIDYSWEIWRLLSLNYFLKELVNFK